MDRYIASIWIDHTDSHVYVDYSDGERADIGYLPTEYMTIKEAKNSKWEENSDDTNILGVNPPTNL